MAQFEGHLENAPVVYVLCQIRFSPVEKMADYVPAIQEALRGRYPKFEKEQIGGVTFAPNAQPFLIPNETRWRFETRDSQTGFVLSTNQLIVHTTSYFDSHDFREQILFGFRIVHAIARLGFIQRVGLRYVNLITASADDTVESYIDASLIGFRPNIGGLTSDVSQQFLRAKSSVGGRAGTLLAKISRARHASDLPGDLLPMSLRVKRNPTPESESIFLDWDHHVEGMSVDPDADLLEKTLRELKEPIASIFKAAITEHAVNRWRRH